MAVGSVESSAPPEIKIGDVLLEVNGRPVEGLTLAQVQREIDTQGTDAGFRFSHAKPAAAEETLPRSKVCSVCGNVFMPDAVFCRRCGSRRPEVHPSAASGAASAATPEPQASMTVDELRASRSPLLPESGGRPNLSPVRERVLELQQQLLESVEDPSADPWVSAEVRSSTLHPTPDTTQSPW